mmetsp:Transcript_11605/g.27052  ORF Transcript_11605/g.27052 Transcript_11605/m.27052 type:complete len:281 (-) Transcript_11605:44-886(-)
MPEGDTAARTSVSLGAARREDARPALKADRPCLPSEQEMAKIWEEHHRERAERSKQERQKRLEAMQQRRKHAGVDGPRARQAMLAAVTPQEDAELMAKYGHLIRVPPIPYTPRRFPQGGESQEQLSSTDSPPARAKLLPEVPRTGSSSRSARSSSKTSKRPGAVTLGTGEVLQLLKARQKKQIAAKQRQTTAAAEPGSALVARKHLLRKAQSDILKRTEVVFYRGCMRNHFQNILQAVEAKLTNSDKKQQQALLNLAKPMTSAEIKNYIAANNGKHALTC